MIKRLRPAYSDQEIEQLYAHRYDHTLWPDHIQRVAFTREFVREVMAEQNTSTVADLSCGDGAVALSLSLPRESVVLGDIHRRDGLDMWGRIEDTVTRMPDVDLFVLSETLEHIDDPWGLLEKIRAKARTLVLTTPVGEIDDGNPEHYWGWDRDGVESILWDAGWWPDRSVLFTPDVQDVYYTYQIWMATRDEP